MRRSGSLAKNIRFLAIYYIRWTGADLREEALSILPEALIHVLELEDGKQRFCDSVLAMTKAFALCRVLDKALALRDEVAFLQAVRALLIKGDLKPPPPRTSTTNCVS